MSAACVERQDMIEYNNIEDIQVMSKEWENFIQQTLLEHNLAYVMWFTSFV